MPVSRKTLQIKDFFSDIEFNEGDNLLEILNARKVGISQTCGGFGTCTTCRVLILTGVENCSPRTEIEQERALERKFLNNERLACQLHLTGNVQIEILNPDEESNQFT